MSTDASSAAQHLARLVSFKTQQAGADGIAGEEQPICDHLAHEFAKRGAQTTLGTGTCTDGRTGAYVLASWGTPKRVINIHIDTVPANAGWSRDPWEAHVENDRLYGLGSADTKGAIAAALVALDTLGVTPQDIGILCSGDEEAGSGVMTAFLDGPHKAGIEQVIVCEPTARAAGIAHRGVLAQKATLTGPGGHSSKADFLPKPLANLARLATHLDDAGIRRLYEGPAGMTGTCLNLAALAGGVAFNVIPGRAELEWSIRPYPGFDVASWNAEVTRLAQAIHKDIVIETTVDHAPFACDALAELVRPHVHRVGNLDFWTEAALWSAAGIDAIVVGPGDIGQAHAADEFVSFDDLAWAVGLMRALLVR